MMARAERLRALRELEWAWQDKQRDHVPHYRRGWQHNHQHHAPVRRQTRPMRQRPPVGGMRRRSRPEPRLLDVIIAIALGAVALFLAVIVMGGSVAR